MKKLVLVVMDGVGKSKTGLGDAVTLANTPTLDTLLKECPNTYIKAHGTAGGGSFPATTIWATAKWDITHSVAVKSIRKAQSSLKKQSKAATFSILPHGKSSRTTA